MTLTRMDYKAWLKSHYISEDHEFRYGTLHHRFGIRVYYSKLEVKQWLAMNGVTI